MGITCWLWRGLSLYGYILEEGTSIHVSEHHIDCHGCHGLLRIHHHVPVIMSGRGRGGMEDMEGRGQWEEERTKRGGEIVTWIANLHWG